MLLEEVQHKASGRIPAVAVAAPASSESASLVSASPQGGSGSRIGSGGTSFLPTARLDTQTDWAVKVPPATCAAAPPKPLQAKCSV